MCQVILCIHYLEVVLEGQVKIRVRVEDNRVPQCARFLWGSKLKVSLVQNKLGSGGIKEYIHVYTISFLSTLASGGW